MLVSAVNSFKINEISSLKSNKTGKLNAQNIQNAEKWNSYPINYYVPFGSRIDELLDCCDTDYYGNSSICDKEFLEMGESDVSAEQRETILDMLKFGDSPKTIAQDTGISLKKIYDIIRKNRIETEYTEKISSGSPAYYDVRVYTDSILDRRANPVIKGIQKFKERLGMPVSQASAEEILNAAGIKTKYDEKDGKLTASEYRQPGRDFRWSDLCIKEDKLLDEIKEIAGNADFRNSEAASSGSVEKIRGNAYFNSSRMVITPKLKEIEGSADFSRLHTIFLDKLERIGGDADFSNFETASIPKLKKIGGNACFRSAKIENMPSLEEIGGDADFKHSDIKNISSLRRIGGHGYFKSMRTKYFDSLEEIGRDAAFDSYRMPYMPKLAKIDGRNLSEPLEYPHNIY